MKDYRAGINPAFLAWLDAQGAPVVQNVETFWQAALARTDLADGAAGLYARQWLLVNYCAATFGYGGTPPDPLVIPSADATTAAATAPFPA